MPHSPGSMAFVQRFLISFANCLWCFLPSTVEAQEAIRHDSSAFIQEWQVGVQGLTPTSDDRNIRTLILNGSLATPLASALGLWLHGGLYVHYAYGTITQYGENFTDSTIENRAAGFGGFYELEWRLPIPLGPISFAFNAGHGIVLYTRDFPAGGDIYNFAFRVGFGFDVAITDRHALGLGYRWMHVSNGQGLGPHNPSYEAHGISLSLRSTAF